MDSMMDMEGGMDSGSVGLFYDENVLIARTYWYIVAAVVGLLVAIRMVRAIHLRDRVRKIQENPDSVPSRPESWYRRPLATVTTIIREVSYAQPSVFNFHGRIARHFSVMPMGRCILLIAYWGMLLGMLWANALLGPDDPLAAYYWEKVAFRAAWVSVTQVPLIFCLSAKFNIISLLTGISYERLQWFHRWAGRTLLLTATVHWSFFFREWSLADFVQLELAMMPMVRYGFGSWAIILWTVLTSFGLVRNLCYELFVLQHLAAACVFLWALYTHVPVYAQYNVWIAIAFLAVDWTGRTFWFLKLNIRRSAQEGKKKWTVGYHANLQQFPGLGFVRVIVREVSFPWQAGQHIYLSAPTVGIFEAHPFTIANYYGSTAWMDKSVFRRQHESESYKMEDGEEKTLTLLFKPRSGFTRRMLTRAKNSRRRPLRVFIQGPFGYPPDIQGYEALVFIGSGNGAAFTVPLLERLAKQDTCAYEVVFWWIVRSSHDLRWFHGQIERAVAQLQEKSVTVQVHYIVSDRNSATCDIDMGGQSSSSACPCGVSHQTTPAPEGHVIGSLGRSTQHACSAVRRLFRKNTDTGQDSPQDTELGVLSPTGQSTPPEVQECNCDQVPLDYRFSNCVCSLLYNCTRSRGAFVKRAFAEPKYLSEKALMRSSTRRGTRAEVNHSGDTTSTLATGEADPPVSSASTAVAVSKAGVTHHVPQPQSDGGQITPAEPVEASRPPSLSQPTYCHPKALPKNIHVHVPGKRPDMDTLIRPSVERALGSTYVVVCGGAELVAEARMYVARLSDERGVHKGSGAQAIRLWTERGDW